MYVNFEANYLLFVYYTSLGAVRRGFYFVIVVENVILLNSPLLQNPISVLEAELLAMLILLIENV